jgi:tRNA pseudouridine55 synthase
MHSRVDGILLVDKPVGPSSNAVLQQARRLFGAAKAGHAGTLDPLASGLLPVCFGEATKFAQALIDAPKRYRATIRFGRHRHNHGRCGGRRRRQCAGRLR